MRLLTLGTLLSGLFLAVATALATASGSIVEPRTIVGLGLGLVALVMLLYVRHKGGFDSGSGSV
jgi:hypothetical protein